MLTIDIRGPKGSGKTWTANFLKKEFENSGRKTLVIDGDNVSVAAIKEINPQVIITTY